MTVRTEGSARRFTALRQWLKQMLGETRTFHPGQLEDAPPELLDDLALPADRAQRPSDELWRRIKDARLPPL